MPGRQQGIIVLFTLMAVVMLLIASVALVRSFDTSLGLAGNMAFKRDLVNQSERAIAAAINSAPIGGATAVESLREADALANNYSAFMLSSDAHGIPLVLLSDAAWTAGGMTGADIIDASITVRYVIDRLCAAPTPRTALPLSTDTCTTLPGAIPPAGTILMGGRRPTAPAVPVYRISVRVTGPRNTQTFVQSTVSL